MIDADALGHWFSTRTLFGASATQWALAAATALLTHALILFALRFALRRIEAVALRTRTSVDDICLAILRGTSTWLIALVSLLIGLGMLDLAPRWNDRVGQLWFIALAVQVALWAHRGINIGLKHYSARHASPGMSQVGASVTLMSWGLHTALWAVLLLAMLSNLGINITAFVASLGVGGIAVALAVQNILSDLFASLSIAVDKPFEVGDFIVVNGLSGSVEHVGLKTTRIRSLGGEQIVMSNTELLKNTVSNYKRLVERRIAFRFGVSYGTTPEQAEAIPGLLRGIIGASDKLRFDRVHFAAFGESSLDYEVVYIVLDPDYKLYMDEQQRINLAMMREFARLGVEFAFPTRTVIVTGEAVERLAPPRLEAGEPRDGRRYAS